MFFGRREFAVVLADPWQKTGLGSKIVDYIIGIAEDKNLENIYGLDPKGEYSND